MRFVIKSLIAVASTVTASAAAVAAVNHTDLGQKHTPDCVKNACSKTEGVVVDGYTKTVELSKKAIDKLTGQVADGTARIKELRNQRYSPEVVAQILALESEIKGKKNELKELMKAAKEASKAAAKAA